MAGAGNTAGYTEATKVSAKNQQRSKAKLKVTRTGGERSSAERVSSPSVRMYMKNTYEQKMWLVNGKRMRAAADEGEAEGRR